MRILFAGCETEYSMLIERKGDTDRPFLFFCPDLPDKDQLDRFRADLCVLRYRDFCRWLAQQEPACWPLPLLVCGPVGDLCEARLYGCADYVADPVRASEILARAQALCQPLFSLRQAGLNQADIAILRLFLANRNQPVPRAILAEQLDLPVDSRAIDMRISRLRRRLASPLPTLRIGRCQHGAYCCYL